MPERDRLPGPIRLREPIVLGQLLRQLRRRLACLQQQLRVEREPEQLRGALRALRDAGRPECARHLRRNELR
jgi:hypothetical protein